MFHALSTIRGTRGSPPQPSLPPSSRTTTLIALVPRPAGPGVEFVQMSVRWSYTTAAPLELTLSCPARGGTVEQVLVRESVINAVLPGEDPDDPGDQHGDVSVTALTAAAHDFVAITLRDPLGHTPPLQLLFATDELVDFLVDTEDLVPLGAETDSASAAPAVLDTAACDADPRGDRDCPVSGPRAISA